jgi:hypothetical protein
VHMRALRPPVDINRDAAPEMVLAQGLQNAGVERSKAACAVTCERNGSAGAAQTRPAEEYRVD